MNRAAFFDIDGTLYRNSLMIEHFNKMVQYEVVDPAEWHNKVKETYLQWRQRKADYDDFMLKIVSLYYEALKGRTKNELDFITSQVISLNGDIVYKYTRSQIENHVKKGELVFFISGSPDFLVERMADKYKATDYFGSKYLVSEDGKYTGEVLPMWDSLSKSKAIDNLVQKYSIDLSKSFAYGDTSGDYSMLSKVGNPVAFNPSRELLDKINSNSELASKTSIIIERKDVIYKLSSGVTLID